MKIIYIGASDGLAETLVERMGQEGNEVCLLSDRQLPQRRKNACQYHFYRIPHKGETFQELLGSIAPDAVIFAGMQYMSSEHEEEADEDVNLLTRSLRTVAAFPDVKFILLSSTEVYGKTEGKADESAECTAVSERGIRFIREEKLLDTYRKQHGMDTVILRASQLYTNQPAEGGEDFLSRFFFDAVHAKGSMQGGVFQPLHVSDLVDAVKRVIDAGKQDVYNVCGNAEVSAERLYQLVSLQEQLKEQNLLWEDSGCVSLADSGRIRKELGWSNFRNLEEQLQKGEITYTPRIPTKRHSRKKWSVSFDLDLRQTVENLLLFAVFFILSSICSSHDILSHVNWMIIYVILLATSYNISQTALATVLASGAYLYSQKMSLPEMTTFYACADTAVAFAQFAFLGLIVSCSVSRFRQDARSARLDLDMPEDEQEDLRAINEENERLENEYEERLQTPKISVPNLYDLISRLTVQEPDRILMETMQVVSELLHTDMVAIYQGQAGSTWLRLVCALGENSAMDGKSWNLAGSPQIYNAVMRGEIYQGKPGSGGPSIVLPVVCRDVPQAVVLVKTLPHECETLYHINLLKTMSLLLRDSMEKALQYEELSRADRYVENMDILRPEIFRKCVHLAREKAVRRVAEYCVVELLFEGSMETAARAASQALRMTDCLGTDEEGRLFALLNNTGPENLIYLQERLADCGMEARLDPDKMAGA